jgi:DNA-binding transcriptional ArsR family regulator
MKKSNASVVNLDKLQSSADMLKALAHPMRIAIIELLENRERMTVTEIFRTLNIEQAVASQHLRILKDRGLLSCERKGKNSFYFLKNKQLTQVIDCIEKHQSSIKA